MQVNKEVLKATKWSAITEIVAKLVTPLTTMVLARLLAPDAFGVMVTATMVISFAEIFTDAGFQKYLIQHAFADEDSLYKSTAVAFWSNLLFSLFLWILIVLFSDSIAHLVGNDGYGLVIAFSCICIPLEAFSSIQMALFRRDFDFKTLFYVRIIGIIIPVFVTIPLAFWTHSYWSLIIGMIVQNLGNAVILTIKSKWKPKWFYDVQLFKDMFSFTMWSMIESISIWLTSYVDVFLVGSLLSSYYMGLYRTSITTVGALMAIIISTTTPVLFSALSRLQSDDEEFKQLFFRFQKIVGMIILPLGAGIFIFRDLITDILLGDQWAESAYFIGWWGLTSAVTIVFSHYCSEVYRAKGKPKYSVIAQVVHLCFLVPTVLYSINFGFDTLCLNRSLIRVTLIGINLILLYILTRISPIAMFSNLMHSLVSVFVMVGFFLSLPNSTDSILIQILLIMGCIIVYSGCLMLFKEERNLVMNFKSILKHK